MLEFHITVLGPAGIWQVEIFVLEIAARAMRVLLDVVTSRLSIGWLVMAACVDFYVLVAHFVADSDRMRPISSLEVFNYQQRVGARVQTEVV